MILMKENEIVDYQHTGSQFKKVFKYVLSEG